MLNIGSRFSVVQGENIIVFHIPDGLKIGTYNESTINS